ncbi:uncharacterized protein LOC115316544 [Ixodes scapularis]|uniref:uncharacterized protein LOC115316544 n=1 Tax=Ixodes scapularis TaxID=6945 RepID=UPI001A9E0549|nr:uncharacterized protein LOC115316544 [Ixodes scapularis]
MQAKASVMLLMFVCSSSIIHQSESSTTSGPTKQFYDDMETRPILTYQCYQSGNSIDSPNSINYTILWDGTDSSTTGANGTTWSAVAGTPNSYTMGSLTTHYDAASGVGKLETSTVQEDVTVLQPFQGNALYLKIVITSKDNLEVYKIYDVDFKCKNAKTLLKRVCPQPCSWKLTREI